MRAAAAIAISVRAQLGDGIARYDEDWNPLAFGDNLTRQGTAVVLVESGGVEPERPPSDLARLNFVGLCHCLHRLALDDLEDLDPHQYTALPRNRRDTLMRTSSSKGPASRRAPPARHDDRLTSSSTSPIERSTLRSASSGSPGLTA